MAEKKSHIVRTKSGKVLAQDLMNTMPREDRVAKTAAVYRDGKSGRFIVKKDTGDIEVVTAHPKTSATVKSIVAKRRDALKRLANR
jgi:hypothetical protein